MSAPRLPKSVLPADVRALPLDQKIQRLGLLDPTAVEALELIVNDALELRWRSEFHGGVRGGLKLKSEADPPKGGV